MYSQARTDTASRTWRSAKSCPPSPSSTGLSRIGVPRDRVLCRRGFRPTAGGLITHGPGRFVSAFISYNTMQIGRYRLFGFTTADLLKFRTSLDPPWWTIALLGVAVLGFRRADLNARVLGVLLAADFLTVLVSDLAQHADAPSGVSLAPLGYTMASLMQLEVAALYSEECHSEDHVGRLFVDLAYIFLVTSLFAALPQRRGLALLLTRPRRRPACSAEPGPHRTRLPSHRTADPDRARRSRRDGLRLLRQQPRAPRSSTGSPTWACSALSSC